MFLDLLGVLKAGLSLWDDKEKHKYVDKIISLEKQWYEEDNRTAAERDNAALDRIEFELRLVARGWASLAGKSDSGAG